MMMISSIYAYVLLLQISTPTPLPSLLPVYVDIDEGIYYIQPAHSSPNWDWSVDCWSSDAKVGQWDEWQKDGTQQFEFTKTSDDDWYTIKCKQKNVCWYRSTAGWIAQADCNTNDDRQKFKFIMTDDAFDQFVIEIKNNQETVEIRSTDNNRGEQLHAGNQRYGNQFQRFKITPTTGYYPYLDDGTYFIQPGSHDNWYWSVDCSLSTTKVQQYNNWHRNMNQQFKLTKKSGGWYRIECKNNNKCWDSSGSWISYKSCVSNDAGQYFRFIKAIGTTDIFIIEILYQSETVGIRSTDNNNHEQLHADSTRSGNDYQQWKVIPENLVTTVGGITHIGTDYWMGDADDRLQFISGTNKYDDLFGGWPLSVKWTDRLNNVHIIQLRDTHSEYTLYFPCSSKINWYYGGGHGSTTLHDDTKWARVKFSYVSSWWPWNNYDGIKVEVHGYKYKSGIANHQEIYEKVKEGIELGVNVENHINVLANLGYMNVVKP